MPEIRAAGFVVFRRISGGVNGAPKGAIEYLTLLSGTTGEWGPPKGHNDPGESDVAAAWRETVEETGLTTEDLQLSPWFERRLGYRVPRGEKTVYYGLAECTNAAILLSHEHSEFRWASLEDTTERVRHADLQALYRETSIFLKDPAFRCGLDAKAARAILLAEFAPGERVVDHTANVAGMARAMAEAWAGVDADFVEACAWLHDIGRSIEHSSRHPFLGFQLVVDRGYPGYAPTCISHATKGRAGDEECSRACDLSTFETFEHIVALADFLAVQEKKGTIEQRYDDLVARYGASRFIDEARDIAVHLRAEFEQQTGRDLYEVTGISA